MAYQYRGATHENHGPGNPDAMWHAGVLAQQACELSTLIGNLALWNFAHYGPEVSARIMKEFEETYNDESK